MGYNTSFNTLTWCTLSRIIEVFKENIFDYSFVELFDVEVLFFVARERDNRAGIKCKIIGEIVVNDFESNFYFEKIRAALNL